MENTIEVESAEVAMDISLEDGITRNGKSPNENYLLEQNHQPVCSIRNEWVGMNIICCSECHCKINYKCSLLSSYQQKEVYMCKLHTCQYFRYNTRKCRHRNKRAKGQLD